MKIQTILAGLLAASTLPLAAQAATIDTTPFWDNSTGISSFGGGATGVYGETFVSPGTAITGFTVYVDDFGSQLDGVVAQVYSWSGSLTGGSGPQGATGPALFTSSAFTIAGAQGFQAINVNTGSTTLTVGGHYVLLLADTGGDSNGSQWGLTGFYSHPGVAGDGGFNFYNNDHTTGSINTNNWDSFADFGSLAYTANFTGGVPEPATWALMIGGLGGVGAMMRRRRTAMAAA